MLAGDAILAVDESRMNADPSSLAPGLKSVLLLPGAVECNVSSPLMSGARVSDWF